MKTKKRNTDHIVAKGWGEQAGGECLNCGAVLRVQLPLGIPDFTAQIKAFIRTHRDCKSQLKDEEIPA